MNTADKIDWWSDEDTKQIKQGKKDIALNCRLFAFKNHCKIICMKYKKDHYVIEMSANFTSNTRTEHEQSDNSLPRCFLL